MYSHSQSRYIHTQNRMMERFGHEMTSADYDEMSQLIAVTRPFDWTGRVFRIKLSSMTTYIYVAICPETKEIKTVLTRSMAERSARRRKKGRRKKM